LIVFSNKEKHPRCYLLHAQGCEGVYHEQLKQGHKYPFSLARSLEPLGPPKIKWQLANIANRFGRKIAAREVKNSREQR
jgi:hypothetical protein